ncbi:PREDICTED: zinc finger protein 557-like [Papilio polytes]|uniref:zinc finger protein 557-like n=1 Tax=Papilio polytes TaxID=76194 RepID=UPI000676490A|nr:PREDICTED: zinc finger protein 557-like [Papilio polytes]XP_013144615.1 PREDICTED: zinc finger protein 557-like [Papilio polytes]
MESKPEAAQNLLCMACLCVEKALHELKSLDIIKYYLNCISEISLSVTPKSITICWECEAMLKRAVTFREQVKDSYRILQTYTSENLAERLLSDVSRPPRLKMFANENINIVPENTEWIKTWRKIEYVKDELKIEDDNSTRNHLEEVDVLISDNSDIEENSRLTKISNIKNNEKTDIYGINDKNTNRPKELQIVCVKDELKVEFDKDLEEYSDTKDCLSDCSDSELESELQKFISAKKNKKSKRDKGIKKRRKLKRNSKKLSDENDKKIIPIKLTYEEMLLEREKGKEKDVFRKAKYKCENCIIGFNSNKTYNTHIMNKHTAELGKHKCPICSTIISTLDSFTEHCKRHFRRYECVICQKRTIDKKSIEQHYYTNHEMSLKEYRCELCGKISKSIDSHRYHTDSHKSRVQCTDCEKTFSHRAGLVNHRLAVHELQNTFPCTVCDKVFRWKTSLKRHLEKHDAKTKPTNNGAAFCVTCSIEFSSICSYKRHLRNSLKHVTRDQLKFICDHCKKRFADKTKLRDHIEDKHLHKVYNCHICNKATKNRVGLDQHIRYVHRDRPNNKMCHYCGKGFPTKVQLESHIRTHTGERPFICEYCPTTFSQKSNLYKHNRQVHLNIKTKRYSLCKKRKEDKKDSSTEDKVNDQKSCPELFISKGNNDQFIAIFYFCDVIR